MILFVDTDEEFYEELVEVVKKDDILFRGCWWWSGWCHHGWLKRVLVIRYGMERSDMGGLVVLLLLLFGR